ncbi:MAG TPA: SprT family zinc-dependent metalloprotease [Steroidobacteraceae bacterium]|nr:SprT family zinc-dependent metalloprotease [Steroidobacteraceae bacterium]
MRTPAAGIAQLNLLDPGAGAEAWRVRPSERARRLAVRVLPGGVVEVVVPQGTRPRTVQQFVARHRRWIEHKVEQYRPVDAMPADRLPDSVRFAASGHDFRLRYTAGEGSLRLQPVAELLVVRGDVGRVALVRHALQRFTMHMARAVLAPRLRQLSAVTGLRYRRLQIRRQRTRWGSCSRSGTISLNACLLFQPPPVVDYLLIHELAHTRHMNHSQRFWALVARHEPRWRELDAALMLGWRAVPAWVLH